jgi:uncharacterized protein
MSVKITCWDDNVIIKKSKINGRGVFAARDFKKGEVVNEWNVIKTLTKRQLDKLSADEKKCVSGIGKGKYVLIGEPARFVNHSCEANTFARGLRDVATRNIHKGEEITANYSNEEYPVKFKCNCSGKKCRKIIP